MKATDPSEDILTDWEAEEERGFWDYAEAVFLIMLWWPFFLTRQIVADKHKAIASNIVAVGCLLGYIVLLITVLINT